MITISLCMIVKNEEQTLERCLSSVAGIPDEIVIVDTGSGDATKEIARRFTANVYDFDWIDDFAAARNDSFSHATMDYVLWLDADDVLLPDDRNTFLQLKNSLNPTVDVVYMPYNTAFDTMGNVLQSAKRSRLVNRSRNFRWAGVVHEDLVLEGEYRYCDSDVAITHQKPADRPKSTRNLQIYEKHFASGFDVRPLDLFHYARELEENGAVEKAVSYYLQYLDTGKAQPGTAVYALDRLARCYYKLGDLRKEWECTLRSLEFDVPRPEFSCRFGEHFLKRDQFRQAIFWYELALQNPGGDAGDVVSENYPFRTWLPHKQLGLCYYRIGDYGRSLQHNREARQYVTSDPDLDTNIRVLEKLIVDLATKSQGATGGTRTN
jgi:glycosyltransferase involved in cell wall biosynthesis